MQQSFYSNGKLLVTGEYLVLDGALAFALPTKFGQNLIVENGSDKQISWSSYDADGSSWFKDTITFEEIAAGLDLESDSVKTTLIAILHEAFLLNPSFITNSQGYKVSTHLGFPKSWGLGTSSTLINNIARWLQIDAYTLLTNSFGGSGYDIACAQNDTPILYHLKDGQPIVQKIQFKPAFDENIYFVYLNKKQSSKEAIRTYNINKRVKLDKTISLNDKITVATVNANTLQSFTEALNHHEAEMSTLLEMPTVKESLFPDFEGSLKSLGAWGGDFVMVVSKDDPTTYFESKGYNTILKYDEMILI